MKAPERLPRCLWRLVRLQSKTTTSNKPVLTGVTRYSLCYTTIRPSHVSEAIFWWLERARKLDRVEIVVTTDVGHDDVIAAAESLRSSVASHGVVLKTAVNEDLPGNCVKGWNLAASLSTGDVIIAMSDDFVPPPGWDTLLDIATDWSKPAVLKVSDGYNHDLCTLAIVSRPRYIKFGYLFYPAYESMFCDTELTFAAAQDGVLVNANHLLFEHLHPDCNKRARDAVDLVHGSSERYETGRMIFDYRRSLGFPIDLGPTVVKKVLAGDVAVYLQVIKDDLCLREVVDRLADEGIRNFFFHVPDEYWSGEPALAEDTEPLMALVEKFKTDRGVNVWVDRPKVAKYRSPGRSRIIVETLCRNDALAWVRSCGFNHIAVVDGDELWKPGLLNRLLEKINNDRPNSVFTGMIPVIGLPGYPVEAATDKATIYVGPDVNFQECRGAEGFRHDLGGREIYHFTATRKSMDEIVAKSRRSGHYDDKGYDFEGWIKNVLPKIEPGLVNAHMYRHYQVWPKVRAWQSGELELIPVSLHQYLGKKVDAPTEPSSGSPHLSGRFTPSGWPKAN
jgi:glycosyltransferase involved in cell wall biosynthesis